MTTMERTRREAIPFRDRYGVRSMLAAAVYTTDLAGFAGLATHNSLSICEHGQLELKVTGIH